MGANLYSSLALAVSQTSNPLGSWNVYEFDAYAITSCHMSWASHICVSLPPPHQSPAPSACHHRDASVGSGFVRVMMEPQFLHSPLSLTCLVCTQSRTNHACRHIIKAVTRGSTPRPLLFPLSLPRQEGGLPTLCPNHQGCLLREPCLLGLALAVCHWRGSGCSHDCTTRFTAKIVVKSVEGSQAGCGGGGCAREARCSSSELQGASRRRGRGDASCSSGSPCFPQSLSLGQDAHSLWSVSRPCFPHLADVFLPFLAPLSFVFCFSLSLSSHMFSGGGSPTRPAPAASLLTSERKGRRSLSRLHCYPTAVNRGTAHGSPRTL